MPWVYYNKILFTEAGCLQMWPVGCNFLTPECNCNRERSPAPTIIVIEFGFYVFDLFLGRRLRYLKAHSCTDLEVSEMWTTMLMGNL